MTNTTPSTQTERELFEDTYRAQYPTASGRWGKFEQELGEYADTCVQVGWMIWQSARAAQPQVQESDEVECCNDDCNWRGPLSETLYCGAVGPLCPDCHEVTEPVAPALREAQPTTPRAELRAFQDWFEADAMPAESDWFKRDDDGTFHHAITAKAWRAWAWRSTVCAAQVPQVQESDKERISAAKDNAMRVFKDSCNHTHEAIDYMAEVLYASQVVAPLAANEVKPLREASPASQEPVGYLPMYELGRLRSGHDARLRSAKFGPSALDGDVPVFVSQPPAVQGVTEPEWITRLRDELKLSKATHAFTFLRDDVIALLAAPTAVQGVLDDKTILDAAKASWGGSDGPGLSAHVMSFSAGAFFALNQQGSAEQGVPADETVLAQVYFHQGDDDYDIHDSSNFPNGAPSAGAFDRCPDCVKAVIVQRDWPDVAAAQCDTSADFGPRATISNSGPEGHKHD